MRGNKPLINACADALVPYMPNAARVLKNMGVRTVWDINGNVCRNVTWEPFERGLIRAHIESQTFQLPYKKGLSILPDDALRFTLTMCDEEARRLIPWVGQFICERVLPESLYVPMVIAQDRTAWTVRAEKRYEKLVWGYTSAAHKHSEVI